MRFLCSFFERADHFSIGIVETEGDVPHVVSGAKFPNFLGQRSKVGSGDPREKMVLDLELQSAVKEVQVRMTVHVHRRLHLRNEERIAFVRAGGQTMVGRHCKMTYGDLNV